MSVDPNEQLVADPRRPRGRDRIRARRGLVMPWATFCGSRRSSLRPACCWSRRCSSMCGQLHATAFQEGAGFSVARAGNDPRAAGSMGAGEQDQPLDREMQDVLGTDKYIFRDYVNERIAGAGVVDTFRDSRRTSGEKKSAIPDAAAQCGGQPVGDLLHGHGGHRGARS